MRKEQKADNKVCPYCGKVFVQKSIRDRHVQNQHEDRDFNHTFADETIDDGTVVPLTLVFEFDRNDQPRPSNLSPNAYASDTESAPNQTTELLNVSFISNDENIVETEMTEIDNETLIYEVFEQPFTISTSPAHETNHDNELNKSNNLSNGNLELAEELIRMAEKCENTFEKTFKERLLLKIKSELRNRFYKVPLNFCMKHLVLKCFMTIIFLAG